AALLIERISGAHSLGDALDNAQGDSANAIAWDAIGECIARFHRAGAFHADLNVDNVLMDAQSQIWLIDFDRGAMRKPARGWQRANLLRLQRSLRKRVGVALDSEPLASGWRSLLASYETAMRQPKIGAVDAQDGRP
ncbi:MAG: lipopolysaccharide kinase InaA family protein, partial [Lysobacteraceae bacterium]